MSAERVLLLGDSILKGIVVDEAAGKYVTDNRMGLDMLAERFGLSIENASHFGATVEKGQRLLGRFLDRGRRWDTVIMDFGGNESDWEWADISAEPAKEHASHLSLAAFTEKYRTLIRTVKEAGMRPVVTTLPPLLPEQFITWRCRGLDAHAVREWLGDVTNIYTYQERYSRAVETLAREEKVRLLDIRSAFTARLHLEKLICVDGTHPNFSGQAVISEQLCTLWTN